LDEEEAPDHRHLQRAQRLLAIAAEHLAHTPELSPEFTQRAQARIRQLAPTFGEPSHDPAHQRSLAIARSHLRTASQHLDTVIPLDRGFFSRARAHRACLASHAEALECGFGGTDTNSELDLHALQQFAQHSLERLLGQPEQLTSATGIACEHNCLTLETAFAEMRAVAAQNVRVKDPVYHVVISWPKGEVPTEAQAFTCARHALKAVGMQEHQYVFAMHRDTAHAHVHLAVNRVHPDTGRAVYPDRDYFHLDRAMRELELQFGWHHDKGPYAVFERNGVKVIDWASRAPGAANPQGKRPTRAADMERHGDTQSLFSYAQGAPKTAALKALKSDTASWTTLHATLAQYGLQLRPKGQGLAVYDLADEATSPIKASDMHETLSKARLIKRLGAYEPPQPTPADAPRLASYDKQLPPERDSAHPEPHERNESRDQRRQARAQARHELLARFARYKASFTVNRLDPIQVKHQYAAVSQSAKQQRGEVRNTVQDPLARKALYSVIAFETLRARERLKRQITQERNALRGDPTNRRLSYREWVVQEAKNGDTVALSQQRSWAYAERRGMRQPEEAAVSHPDLSSFKDVEPSAQPISAKRRTPSAKPRA
jgi:hypothetical protein